MSDLPKGFEDLLETADETFGGTGDLRTYAELAIDKVEPGPWQPRQVFDPEEISGLAASIERNGQLDPILAVHRAGSYYIVAGERRYRALKQLGRSTIEAILIREDTAEQKLRELAIISNVQRENLDPFEEAASYQALMDEHQHTLESLGEVLGKKKSTVHDVLRLNELSPSIRAEFRTSGNSISKSILIEVAREKAIKKRQALWQAVRDGQVTNVRQARARKKAGRKAATPSLKTQLLSSASGLTQRLQAEEAKKLTYSDEEYDTLLTLFDLIRQHLDDIGPKR
jgi:ParB family chromosome partitioning protein